MFLEDARIMLGEWLPDRPTLNNPGIVEAQNTIPLDDFYRDFPELNAYSDTLPETVIGAFAAVTDGGSAEIYAGTATDLYQHTGGTWVSRASSLNATPFWQFAQFDSRIFATDYNDDIQYKTVGSASSFTALTVAPNARHLGVINRFLFAGHIDQGAGELPYVVQWSSINDPLDWPAPGTSTAKTRQAGEQYLQAEHGAVTAIAGGQFWGLIFQKRAITRFTYVGGAIVFQVDNFERSRGCWCPRSHIQVGNVSFFFSHDGVCATDGQAVRQIGDGRVDRWLLNRLNQGGLDNVTAGVDWVNKCVYWLFPTENTSPDTVLIYSLSRNRFAWASQNAQLLFSSFSEGVDMDSMDAQFPNLDEVGISLDSPIWQGGVPTIMGWSGDKFGLFNGAAPTAVFETAEIDGNPMGLLLVHGIRPLVTGNPSTITTALSLRDTQDNASPVFGSAVARTTRTGICDFRDQGRFIAARMTVSGGFDRAMGLQFDAQPGDIV